MFLDENLIAYYQYFEKYMFATIKIIQYKEGLLFILGPLGPKKQFIIGIMSFS